MKDMKIFKILPIAIAAFLAVAITSCDDTRSYSDLLKDEQKVSNWFLAQHRVCDEIPADSVFETGPDAPYYKLDPDGYVYMQVIKVGDGEIPTEGDQVYFTYSRYNIQTMYSNGTLDVAAEESNQDDFLSSIGQSYFIFGNYYVSSSASYGQGIQMPVSYLGYNSEVNILLKSYYGFSTESSTCIPYKVNTRYFKAEY